MHVRPHRLTRVRRVAATLAVAIGIRATTAGAQTPVALPGLRSVDSMAGAEFGRDSIASLTIGVVTGQGLVWTKSYGLADMAARTPATRASVYRIGSITKMFTGLMLHQLVAAGKIRLSDPVERYYPEIKELRGYSRLTAPITVLQLATMTGGLAREPAQEGPFWTGPVSAWDSTVHLALSHTAVEFTPGTRFSYSNIGYAILGATLGRAAGTPYVRWQQERIFAPLGMTHTAFEIDDRIRAGVTRGYDINRDGAFDGAQSAREAITGRWYKVPNGAIYTTVDDLSRFVQLQLGKGPASVVAPARLDSAYAGIVAATGDLDAGYGVGFMAQRRGEFTWFGHNGGVAGFGADMYFDREHQVGVIVLRNATGGRVRGGRLAVDVLKHLIDAKLAAAKTGAQSGASLTPR